MPKGTLDKKWYAVENMLRDGVDIMTILKWTLVRTSLDDLLLIHRAHLRDNQKDVKNA